MPEPRTPDDLLSFLRSLEDERILGAVRALGEADVLRLVFSGMAARYGLRPGRIPGVMVFELDDDGTVHRHGVRVTEGGAQHVPDPDEPSKAVVRTTLLRFLRVATGAQDPRRLVVMGRLRLSGDVIWAVTTLAALRR